MRPPGMGRAGAIQETATRQEAAAVEVAGDCAHGGGQPAWADLDVCVDYDGDAGESAPAEYDVQAMPADFTLESLHQKWRSGDVRIPRLQRGYAWTPPQASKLIESFMAGLPVPPVYLAMEGNGCDGGQMTVVDGVQRLLTVFSCLDAGTPGTRPAAAGGFALRGSTGPAGSTAGRSGTWTRTTSRGSGARCSGR